MDNKLARILFEQGARIRNPSLFQVYDELKSSEWLTRGALQNLQLEKAQSFLTHAGSNSEFYRKIFKDCNFVPGNFSQIADLSVLPEIEKSDLVKNHSAIHIPSVEEPMLLAASSGTSGLSLKFHRNERWDSLNRASVMRAYDWYGVKPWDRNGYLWGFNIASKQKVKIKLLDALQNRFRLFDYSPRGIEQFVRRLSQAKFVGGYSSMVYEVAKTINELGIQMSPLRLVKGTSEMILDVYQKESKKAFGRRITSEYGAAESGLIAFECPEGRMHINIENIILEVNDNREVLVTNLASASFPIIRYNLGDVVSLSDEACPCGRAHPIISHIEGRKGTKVKGFEKQYPPMTFYYVFKNISLENNLLLNYKAIQQDAGFVDILIEGDPSKKAASIVGEQLDQYFAGDVSFNIRFVDRFDIGQQKRQYFESTID